MNLPSQVALARYGAIKVTTANPGQVLVMLYDGLIRFLREASTAMAAGDRKRAGERISRSHAILGELLGGLDPTQSQTLCERLTAVYGFCMRHVVKANIEQDPAKLDEVIKILAPLRDAWMTAVAEVAAAPR
ncbi:MAG TPA: flagellar export chaperone FliS [Polyangiaceae bacterium]|jgi:flagellar protein FliS